MILFATCDDRFDALCKRGIAGRLAVVSSIFEEDIRMTARCNARGLFPSGTMGSSSGIRVSRSAKNESGIREPAIFQRTANQVTFVDGL